MTRDNPQNLRNKEDSHMSSSVQNMLDVLRVTVTHLAISERNTKMLQHFHCITIKDLMLSQPLHRTNKRKLKMVSRNFQS